MTFTSELEKLAKHVTAEAMKPDTVFADKTEAMKVLTTYFAILTKYKQKQEDGDGTDTFEDFAKKLETAESPPNGSTKVRGRRGAGH